MFGGNSRANASIAVTTGNTSLVAGQTYFIDVSADALLYIVPSSN